MPYKTFSIDEVARYLHLTVAAVEELVKRREIPCVRQGSRLVFTRSEIDAWASRRILGMTANGVETYHKEATAKVHDLSPGHAIVPELLSPAELP